MNVGRLILMSSFCLPIIAWGQTPDTLSGTHIIHEVNRLLNPESSSARVSMTIQTSSGGSRTFEYDSWSKNFGEKNMIRYLSPFRVRDQAILMLNHADDIWMYFPRTNRIRKLATHAKRQKMEGSDFSYEDMGSGNSFIDDYTSRRKDDETWNDFDCYVLEMDARPGADAGYSRLMMWIDKSTFVPVRVDYYDAKSADRPIKRLVQSEIQIIDSIPTAMNMVMTNLRDQGATIMKFREIRYNIPIPDDRFTERGLRR